MSPRTALNAALALAVAVAGIAVWWSRDKAPEPDATYPLTTLAAADVRAIEIRRRGVAAIKLRRTDAGWLMEEPWSGRASPVPVTHLLDLARMRATARFPAEELGRFELDRPWARVVFNGHTLDFGSTNAMTRDLYVASGGYVYPIPARSGSAIPQDPSVLLDRNLFGPDEEPIAFVLPGLNVAHDGTRWSVDPALPQLSQDDLQQWVERWRHASALAVRPASTNAAPQSAKIRLRSGSEIEIGIVARAPRIVLRRVDEAREYEIPADLGARLFVSPGANEERSKP